jgi:hypothetical protein
MPLLTCISINCTSISRPLLWLNLWFPILDHTRLQHENSAKNDILVQLAAGSTEQCELYNCLQPINPAPILYLPHTSRSTAIDIRYFSNALTLQTAYTRSVLYVVKMYIEEHAVLISRIQFCLVSPKC